MVFNLRAGMLMAIMLVFLTASTAPAGAIGQQDEPDEPAEPAAPVEEAEDEVKLIKMYVEEWKWTPKLIRVPVGTKVRIEFLSYGASRRFDLKAYRLKVRLPQDKTVAVEFVADKKGEFKWRCGRPCGDGCAKLSGKLIVE
jgi:heme/copper-type cytochrome/quinol oxidase subunit 2